MPKINKVKVNNPIFSKVMFFKRSVCFFYLQLSKRVGKMNQQYLISIKSSLWGQVPIFFLNKQKKKKNFRCFWKSLQGFPQKKQIVLCDKGDGQKHIEIQRHE